MNPDDAATPWRKSSYSDTKANCVQTAQTHTGKIAVQDSKNPNGGTLAFTTNAWKTFIAKIQRQ
ncbi:MAG TPA: DUF397 domain-containing protein [Streptosporangiaceae bacterium]|jgi:hypothetical protein